VSEVRAALTALHDIRGVQGSFLSLVPGGELVTRDALPVVSDAVLGDTGRRLSNIFQAMDVVCSEPDEVVLRFEGLSLFVRRSTRAMLAVLVADAASLPALRMAANLVLRQVAKLDLTPAPTVSVPVASPPTAKTEPAPRLWRGRPI
jgi:hypothetical protein